MAAKQQFEFYEFFAGGGMARLGLGNSWRCVFANDLDEKKAAVYRANFRWAPEMHCGDIQALTSRQLPGRASLAWASFPCQDLSLAGAGAGLSGERSGVFWAFWKLMLSLKKESRMPPIIALENVTGLLTSHEGKDLSTLLAAIMGAGYRVGAFVLDAALFVAQSRPRLFIVAAATHVAVPSSMCAPTPSPIWHPAALRDVVEGLPYAQRERWVWWKLPAPTRGPAPLADLIEPVPKGVEWHNPDETARLIRMMSAPNRQKLIAAQRAGRPMVGAVYKRTRNGEQRAEIRFDGLSGCLRTPAGGSSRQIIMIVDGEEIRSRLISPRETARLMGLPDSYRLPSRYNDAYHLTGDGVVVPAVAWVESHLLRPLAAGEAKQDAKEMEGHRCVAVQ